MSEQAEERQGVQSQEILSSDCLPLSRFFEPDGVADDSGEPDSNVLSEHGWGGGHARGRVGGGPDKEEGLI